ncbi:hypothetical protein, partial [Streptomyces milbemycinicus]
TGQRPRARRPAPSPASPDRVAHLASRLPGMSAAERAKELALLSSADREQLASDPALIDALEARLPAPEFAATAARLLIQVPKGVNQPDSARREVLGRLTPMLGNPKVAATLLRAGARVVVVPKDEAMTSLAPFRHLRGKPVGPDGRVWDTVRGVGGRTTAVTEENLLGKQSTIGDEHIYAKGYSTTTHEFAHAIHQHGLSDKDRKRIRDAFYAKRNRERRSQLPGSKVPPPQWPDGVARDLAGQPVLNYSARDEYEFFAQLTNAYLGTNEGTDPYTGQRRNNGAQWVREYERGRPKRERLLPLLERLYGTSRIKAENHLYEGFRGLWDQAENTHRPQPHVTAPAPDPAPTAPATVDTLAADGQAPPPPQTTAQDQQERNGDQDGDGTETPETGTDTPETTPPKDPLSIEHHLDRRRPPRLDRGLPPAPLERDTARFTDGSRMPAPLDGIRQMMADLPEEVLARSAAFGTKDFTLRGTDQALKELERELRARPGARPRKPRSGAPRDTGLLAEVATALREDLGGLSGDGREFTYTDEKGRVRVLHLAVRHYGGWERFTDTSDGPRKIESTARTQRTTGRTPTQSTSYALNPFAPLWPLTKPLGVFGRVGLRFARTHAVGYTLTSQTTSQSKTSSTDTSHRYLDDVYYEFTVTDERGRPVTEDGGRTPATFGFGMRGGLSLRLSDSAATESKPGRIPRLIGYQGRPHHRLVTTEDFGPLIHVRDWAAGQIGARPGSSAHRELDAFISSRNFQRMARVLGTGRMTTAPLFADDKLRTPLGIFTVQVLPRRAILVDETTAAALKDVTALTLTNERNLSIATGQEINGSVGPAFNWLGLNGDQLNLRFLLGFAARYGHRTTRAMNTGGSGAVKTEGEAKNTPVGLYLVEKAVVVRRVGRDRTAGTTPGPEHAARVFVTWSLDRMPRSEARRLAGWDDGTRLRMRSGAPEPYAPAYLTPDRPPTLGVARVEEFTADDATADDATDTTADDATWHDRFADTILREAARAYPGLVAPLDELDPDNPRWRDADHFQTALTNTLEILTTLAYHTMAGSLETLITSGVRIPLRESLRFKRGYRYLWLDGELTGRRYEGTQTGLKIKHSAPGGEKLDSDHGVVHDLEGGIEGNGTLRTTAATALGLSKHSGSLFLGLSGGRGRGQNSVFGPSTAVERAVASTRPPHLYSYRLRVTVSRGGYWRLPGLLRGFASAGLLGTQPFVFREKPSDVIGTAADGTPVGGGPLTGRVLLSILDEHTSATDPHVAGTANPYRDFEDGIDSTPLDDAQALALAKADHTALDAAARRAQQPFTGHAQLTIAVLGQPALIRAVEESLRGASGGSWHLTQQGAPAHDAALRPFQAPYLTANADQSLSPSGWRITGLWARGPYLNRGGVLAHRMTVAGLTLLSEPAPMAAALKITGGTQSGGKNTVTYSFLFGGRLSAFQPHGGERGPAGFYSLNISPWSYGRTKGDTVTRSVTNEVSRQDNTHQVLVSGNAEHEIAVASSALGTTTGAGSRLVPRGLAAASGQLLAVPGGWIGLLPEYSAVELNLIDDGWGAVPHYDAQTWSPQAWLPGNALSGYPLGELNAAAVLDAFDRALRGLSLDETGRNALLRLASSRLLRALRGDMEGAGSTVPARTGRWGWDGMRIGGRQVRLRVQLIAGAPQFRRLGHGIDWEDNLAATESTGSSLSRTRGPDFGLSVGENAYTHNPDASTAGPGYSETGSARKTLTASHSSSPMTTWTVATSEPYAEYDTPYRLRIVLEVEDAPDPTPPTAADSRVRHLTHRARQASRYVRGKRRVVEEGDVGKLRKQTPLSLMSPDPAGPRTAPAAVDPLGPP